MSKSKIALITFGVLLFLGLVKQIVNPDKPPPSIGTGGGGFFSGREAQIAIEKFIARSEGWK